MDALYKAIELAKLQHVAIGKEVHACLDMGHVISAGPCLYAVIQDVNYAIVLTFCSRTRLLMTV